MRIQTLVRALPLAGLAVFASWAPAPAQACQCLAIPIYEHDSNPKNGAMDVPLNAAAVVEGAFEPGSVTVEDGMGQRVDVLVNEGPAPGGCKFTWAEIIPERPWGPRTTYIIRVKPIYPEHDPKEGSSLTFTTGVDMLPERELTVPKAHASALNEVPALGGCGDFAVLTCLNVEGQTEDVRDVEVIARRDGKIAMRTLLPINDADYGFEGLPDCLELRRRSPTGKRSEAVMLCDLETHKYPKIDPARGNYPSCRNGAWEPLQRTAAAGSEAGDLPKPTTTPPGAGTAAPEPQPSAAGSADRSKQDQEAASDHHEYGCAAAPRGRGPGAVPLALLLMAAVAALRRRRR